MANEQGQVVDAQRGVVIDVLVGPLDGIFGVSGGEREQGTSAEAFSVTS